MKFLQLSILALLSLATGFAHANAENLVQTRLIAEKGYVEAGDELRIGVEQIIAPHWHTYWKNAGDSGTEARITWDLPEGFEISGIEWPTPKKIPYGPLLNYGYEDNVVLLQTLKVPATIPAGAITLTANIEVLVCKEECIPEYGTYTLTLNGPESREENNRSYIQRAAAKMPLPLAANATYSEDENNFILKANLSANILSAIKPETIVFFPEDWGLIQNAAPINATIDDKALTITQERGERELNAVNIIKNIITYETKDGIKQNIEIIAKKAPPNAPQTNDSAKTKPDAPNSQETRTPNITIATALLFALIGGLVLNLMPCVFPVLSIKALSLVKIADKHPALARKHGIAYTLGVVLSFVAIAALLLILKQAGANIGWGFQLQNPAVITGLSALLFVIGLNLAGFFEFTSSFCNIGGKLAERGGLTGSFFTGILATLVASPCTAPFMAGAIGFALTQTPIVNLTIFASLGFGLALPYLLLSFMPALQRRLPKPGAWMETFRTILSIPIFLSAIWLLWVLSQQTTSENILYVLGGMTAFTIGIWAFGHKDKKRLITLILTLVVLSVLALTTTTKPPETSKSTAVTHTQSEAFSHAKLETLLSGDNPVLVEMTAAWCITCKVNHAIGINIPKTREAIAAHNVAFLIGDWTNQDPEITKYLNSFGRNGVPIYVYYGRRNINTGERPEALVLQQILKPSTISNLIAKDNE